MQVFLNGKFVSESAAKVSVFDPGFTSGEGLFESILFRSGQLQFFSEHYARLRLGARALGIRVPMSSSEIREIALALVAKNRLVKSFVRITLTPESFLVTARPWPSERPSTATVCCVEMERALPQIKSLNYLPTVLAQRIAAKRGFDEALLVDRTGRVLEGGRTNFFWVRRGRLYTPDLGSALPGITRGKVLDLAARLGIETKEKSVRPTELLQADEIFLTNAPMEIWPVTRIEQRRLPVGPLTLRLQAAYTRRYS